jgi:hypothetical protein
MIVEEMCFQCIGEEIIENDKLDIAREGDDVERGERKR